MNNIKILRITTVSHSFDLLLKGQMRYVNENGFDVTIACTNDAQMASVINRENVKFHALELTRTINPIKDFISLINAIRLIHKVKPAIVHTHSPKAGIVGMVASWICRVPVKIHTVAGLPLTETTGIKRKMLIFIEKLTYTFADYVLPNSTKQKEFIEDNILRDEKKITIIGKGSSNGIDLEYFKPQLFNGEIRANKRIELNIDKSDIVLSFVGRLTNYKGVNELVSSFVSLSNKHSNIKLLLIGPYEDLNPLSDATLKEIDENKNIINVGHQNDIRPFLAISDIFVFPSYREGFPQSLMQAAAMNLACIASDINGCNEIIEDKKTGILIPVKNEGAIFEACDLLISNENYRVKLANEARVEMETNFEQKTFWNKVLNFYNQKISEK